MPHSLMPWASRRDCGPATGAQLRKSQIADLTIMIHISISVQKAKLGNNVDPLVYTMLPFPYLSL